VVKSASYLIRKSQRGGKSKELDGKKGRTVIVKRELKNWLKSGF